MIRTKSAAKWVENITNSLMVHGEIEDVSSPRQVLDELSKIITLVKEEEQECMPPEKPKADAYHMVIACYDKGHRDVIIRLQAQVRRFLQQRHFQHCQLKIIALETKLRSIKHQKKVQLRRIHKRKDHRLQRADKKWQEKEQHQSLELEKVTSMMEYLRKDQASIQREILQRRSENLSLRKENHRLTLATDQTTLAAQALERKVGRLLAKKEQLTTMVAVLQALKRQLGEAIASISTPTSASCSERDPPSPPQRPRHHVRTASSTSAKAYGSSIRIHAMNEYDDSSHPSRLVQDIYQFTPRTKIY